MQNDDCNSEWASVIQYPDAFSLTPEAMEQTCKNDLYGHGLPTPPLTDWSCDSPIDEPSPVPEQDSILSSSTAFPPNFRHDDCASDVSIVSSDSVYFHVHIKTLMDSSNSKFSSLFPLLNPVIRSANGDAIIFVLDEAAVLNVVLHAIYNMSSLHFTPSSQILCSAVTRLAAYGVSAKAIVSPSSHLHSHLLGYAAHNPLALYALAAFWDLRELAVQTSAHLLACNLSEIPDGIIALMGPVYLKRLFFLQLGRKDALKRILQEPLPYHYSHNKCSFEDQRRLTVATQLASAYLVLEDRADLPTTKIQEIFSGLADHLKCKPCQNGLLLWTEQVIDAWVMVKRTIT